MSQSQSLTILFADVSGSTKLFETRGDVEARRLVSAMLNALAEVTGDPALEKACGAAYRTHPRLCQNSITRLMEHRLFGQPERARAFVRTAHRQQALHHFFYDFCDNQESACSRCELAPENRHPVEEE